MRAQRQLLAAGLAALMSAACATHAVRVPDIGAPRYPEFLRPQVPAAFEGTALAQGEDRAWRFLQSGDLRNAEREVAAVLKSSPAFSPALTIRGFVELAHARGREALTYFEKSLAAYPDDPSALVGRADAYVAMRDDERALEAFEQVLTRDRRLADVGRRADVVRLRLVQRAVTAARGAAAAGRYAEARDIYESAIARTPESGFLHHELAVLERDHGDGDRAIAHYRRAVALDGGDAVALVDLAQMLDARNDFDAALEVYESAFEATGDPAIAVRRDALRARAEAARLPAELRAIESASQITRGDLSAMVMLRVAGLATRGSSRDVGVMTDIRGHWAEAMIQDAARAGIVLPFENHAFQPRAAVRRVELAEVLARLVNRLDASAEVTRWRSARGRFADLTSAHLSYQAVSTVVAAGLLGSAPDGAFQPQRLVSGAEAAQAFARLRQIAGPQAERSRP